jgi:hypothetical protein
LAEHDEPTLVRVSVISRTGECWQIRISPFGRVRMPQLSEAWQAIACVVKAARRLHRFGWAHTDIRWPNVVFDEETGLWVLIDLEEAELLDELHEELDYRAIGVLLSFYTDAIRSSPKLGRMYTLLCLAEVDELRVWADGLDVFDQSI